MDIVYHVNSYHVHGIKHLIRFLKTKPNIGYREYATISSRFYNEVIRNNGTINITKIRLIQECLYWVKKHFPSKIYGFDEFVRFMSKMHETRLNTAQRLLRDWVIQTTENPKCTVGKRRKLLEYNNL